LPQALEQQSCWQEYSLLPRFVHPTTVPATLHIPIPPIAMSWHVPVRAPAALLQRPLQHCASAVHTSFSWRQKDTSELHRPLTQPFEQHSASFAQVLPETLHTPLLIAWHVPVPVAPHLPLQHSTLLEQATLMSLHWLAWQSPFGPQMLEQQSELLEHAVFEPVAMHGPSRLAHWLNPKRPQSWPTGH
jgi:hypothetical protein